MSPDLSPQQRTLDTVAWVETAPDRCPVCGASWALGSGGVLVGWDNRHAPACRVWICTACRAEGHAVELYGALTGPLRAVPDRPRR